MAGPTVLCQQGAGPVHADLERLAAPNPSKSSPLRRLPPAIPALRIPRGFEPDSLIWPRVTIRFGPTVMLGRVEPSIGAPRPGFRPSISGVAAARLYSFTNQGVLCGTYDPTSGVVSRRRYRRGVAALDGHRVRGTIRASTRGGKPEDGAWADESGQHPPSARSEGGWRRGQCRGHFCLGLRPGVRSGAGRGRSCGWSLWPVWWLP